MKSDPIFSIPSGKFISLRLLQHQNAFCPIVFTFDGIFMLSNPVQFPNTIYPMLSNVSGSFISFIFVHPANA